MKLKHQAISAVSATALLLGASVGLITLAGTTVTLAEPIDSAAVAALQAAVNNPNSDLAALINKMNSEVPGSGTQFAQAFTNTDTDALANALTSIAAGNAALQNTIDSALSTLSQEPGLASVTSGGTTINVANVVSTIETTVQSQFASNNSSGNNGNNQNNSNDQQNNNTNLTDNLQNLNPGAGPNNPNNGFNNSTINSPFTRGNPNQNQGLSNTNSSGQPNNSGQPNSRA
jgi:hypothetical protein